MTHRIPLVLGLLVALSATARAGLPQTAEERFVAAVSAASTALLKGTFEIPGALGLLSAAKQEERIGTYHEALKTALTTYERESAVGLSKPGAVTYPRGGKPALQKTSGTPGEFAELRFFTAVEYAINVLDERQAFRTRFWGEMRGLGAAWPKLEEAITNVITAQYEWGRGIHRRQADNARYLRLLGKKTGLVAAKIELAARGHSESVAEDLASHEWFGKLATNLGVIAEVHQLNKKDVKKTLKEGALHGRRARKLKVALRPDLMPRRVLAKFKKLPSFRKALGRRRMQD